MEATQSPQTHPESVGRLILAATPMGHVGDASERLREALASADVVAAEDTRRAKNLAAALDVRIGGRAVSFFEQNEVARTVDLIADIEAGAQVLVITDAGMPSVSDPGYRVVAACVERGLPLTCLPGPSAVTTALAVSGLPVDRFCFDGFVPRKPGARRHFLAALAEEPRTAVFFEAPHRLSATLADAAAVLGAERRAAVCRELTKTYEEVRRGSLAELAAWAAEGQVRGEITVVLAPGVPAVPATADLVEQVRRRVAAGERTKTAVAEVASAHGVSKRELYAAVVDDAAVEPDAAAEPDAVEADEE